MRWPGEEELFTLGRLAEQGVHPPEEMPFYVPWTDAIGEPGFVEGFVAFHLDKRAEWRPESWNLMLGVWAGVQLVGTQALRTEDFPVHGVAETGSWLGRRYQRLGYGTEMRAAILALFFDGLGGSVATSGALDGNRASARVSEKLGYSPVGEKTAAPRGVPVSEQRFELDRAHWLPQIPVEIVGLEPCLVFFGAA